MEKSNFETNQNIQIWKDCKKIVKDALKPNRNILFSQRSFASKGNFYNGCNCKHTDK